MIRLDRTGIEPPIEWFAKVATSLPVSFAERARIFERLAINDAIRRRGFRTHAPEVLPIVRRKPDFPPIWRKHRYVKARIGAMSGHRCAYCQSAVAASQVGHIDHFRPKSLFPALAYDWSNYFLGCERCNIRKRNKWPENGSYVRPDEGDPATRFVFSEDGSVCASEGDSEAERTITDFGLDREMLQIERRLAIELAIHPVKIMLPNIRGRKKKKRLIIDLLKPPLSPYSAAINQSLCRLWASLFPDDPL